MANCDACFMPPPVKPVIKPSIPTTLNPQDAPQLYAKIRTNSESFLRSRLGIPQGTALPPSLATLINTQASEAVSRNLEEITKANIDATVRGQLKAPSFALFDDRIKTALDSADHITQSPDVAAILKQKAELLWAKAKAYKDAGFSPEEAMEILLAEIGAKGKP